jgi:predicted dehydrogenase
VSSSAAGNYTVNYASGNLTVNPALAAVAATKTYDGSTLFTVGSASFTVTGVGGETLTLSTGTGAANSANVVGVSSLATKSSSPIFAPYEYDTSSVTILRFKNGAVGKTAAIVDCLQPYYFHTHLVGSEGSLLDNRFHSKKLKSDKGHWSELSMKMLDSGDVSDHPYQAQFQAFFDALDRGEQMPLTSFPEAKKTFDVIFAADASAAQGGRPISP